jgi:hypothetical protein
MKRSKTSCAPCMATNGAIIFKITRYCLQGKNLDRKCRQESGCIRAYLGLGQHQPEDEQALELIIEWDPTEQLPIS